jgi:hypothetical protein
MLKRSSVLRSSEIIAEQWGFPVAFPELGTLIEDAINLS